MPVDPSEEKLRALLNKRPPDPLTSWKRREVSGDLPYVPDPPDWRPQPFVTGQQLLKPVKELLEFAPELRGQISHVKLGPTDAFIQELFDREWDPYGYGGLGLGGVFSYPKKDIGINPLLTIDSDALRGTLAHEAAHAVGHGHGRGKEGAYLIGDAYQEMMRKRNAR